MGSFSLPPAPPGFKIPPFTFPFSQGWLPTCPIPSPEGRRLRSGAAGGCLRGDLCPHGSPDARGGGLLRVRQADAGVPPAGALQTQHGRAGALHLPVRVHAAGKHGPRNARGGRSLRVDRGDKDRERWERGERLGRCWKEMKSSPGGHPEILGAPQGPSTIPRGEHPRGPPRGPVPAKKPQTTPEIGPRAPFSFPFPPRRSSCRS